MSPEIEEETTGKRNYYFMINKKAAVDGSGFRGNDGFFNITEPPSRPSVRVRHTSGRHSSHSRKNEGADQDFSATASADSLTNSARRRGTAKSTNARTLGTDMRPCGMRRLTGMAGGSASRSRSRNDPS